jgi:hypothetical protein
VKDSTIPSFSVSNEGNITITIPDTQALLQDQGYTYNQAGFTYNQAGVQYGGVYNFNQDVLPMLSVAKSDTQALLQIVSDVMTLSSPNPQTPSEISFTDIYRISFTRYLYVGMPMGLLLDLTYPVTIKIIGQI